MSEQYGELPLVADDAATFWRLYRRLEASRSGLALLNDYYEGDQRLTQLGLAIPPELQGFQVILSWPRVTVDGLEQRLDLVGFRMGDGSADGYLRDLWQYNDLDDRQSYAHIDALALGRSYLCVGTNAVDPEFPLVTIESALEVVTERDPRTRRVSAALRVYGDETTTANTATTQQTRDANPQHAALYLPDVTYWMSRESGQWRLTDDPDVHRQGIVPVVPMVNRDRVTMRRYAHLEGVSEMNDVIPIAESASRAITNGQLAQETHAVPHRVFLGATKADFVKPDGSSTGAFDAYMSGITAISNAAGKAVQFDASDMTNFETMVNLYARQASGVASMPIEYFGLNTQNPPSADGQRAGETRLIKKAERRQTTFGNAWEQMARIALRWKGAQDGVALRSIEAIWQDAGTPTKAQQTDATSKLYQAGLVDWETAQEDLGRTPAQIAVMKQRRENDMLLDTGAAVQAALVAAEQQNVVDPQPVVAAPAAPEGVPGA